MAALVEHWPIAGLVVRTPRIELRWPDDDDLVALAGLAAQGVHDADVMPFDIPWTRAPAGELERNVIQYHWLQRAEWRPENWSWNPVVVVGGQVVGSQGVNGEQFAIRRTVTTGSWLGQRYHGQGIGTEMRAAVLHLAFAGLVADRAETAATVDNAASLAVTRKVGYSPDGTQVHAVEGQARLQLRFVLERDGWEAARRDDIEIEGLDPCLELFGAQRGPADGQGATARAHGAIQR
ncbi:MAG: GNAT family N-acetyltransferase [Acidimicrobiales bacterium]